MSKKELLMLSDPDSNPLSTSHIELAMGLKAQSMLAKLTIEREDYLTALTQKRLIKNSNHINEYKTHQKYI